MKKLTLVNDTILLGGDFVEVPSLATFILWENEFISLDIVSSSPSRSKADFRLLEALVCTIKRGYKFNSKIL